jgi:serine/threonine protein kinase
MTAEDGADLATSAAKRFVLRRRIGEGAFGVVWEAYDRDRSARVALKSLMHSDASAVYLFKREFRALADIVHPNLVTLYELLTFGEQWFFTMEFVEGVDFLKHITSPLLTHVPVLASEAPPPLSPETPETHLQGLSIPSSVDDDKTLGLLKNGATIDWYNEPTVLDAPSNPGPISDPTMQVRLTPIPYPPSDVLRFDPDRLRAALRQLCAGLTTLHEAGKLHRDIKPSNVLVTREGRVVILDFGLVTELSDPGAVQSRRPIVGTPIFMSPEQGLGEPLTPASDWYSVGVMLYAAMTGRVPFDGPPMHVLASKAEVDPVPPRMIAPNIAPDLEEMCVSLLRRRPEDRPTGRDVLKLLGIDGGRIPAAPASTPSISRATIFVGRERHLETLEQAFATVKARRPAAVLVYGGSGMGKSSLIRRFLERVQAQSPEIVVLRGRCYQRESVPYKALDSLVDELSIYLQDLPQVEAVALMPRGSDALVRLFPVLRQVEVPFRPAANAAPVVDPQELRRRAFGALRELLGRMAERRPLVLVIDDLQWGDADSDALLTEIVRPPDPPPLLLVASYRADEVGSSPLMRALRPNAVTPPFEVRELHVGEFTTVEAQRLAMTLLGPAAAGRAEAIAREAEGNPLFIDALARHAQLETEETYRRSSPPSLRTSQDGAGGPPSRPISAPTPTERSAGTPAPPALAASSPPANAAAPQEPNVKLGEMIQARVARLPPGARKLLETLVVAGRPIDVTLARRAAGAESHEPAVLSLLMVSHLVRPRADSPGEEIEIYHDRIRESMHARIPAEEQRAYHDRLAVTLEIDGRADPELLFTHYHGAGRTAKALQYAMKAADEAFDALAFDRAARLYRTALTLGPQRELPIHRRLGESLANAGRGAGAAEAYLTAAAKGSTTPSQALDFRRRAAEQLLISGHVDQGLDVVRQVLDTLGMKLSETPRGALFSLLARRTQLRLRGLKFKERLEDEIPPEELLRVDTCWAIAAGLSLVDNVRGAEFQARHLLLALQTGEPYRIARALAVEVAYSASNGIKSQARTDELLSLTDTLAHRIKKPHALALATTMAGAAKYLAGSWREALMLGERGASMLREQCSGVTWELDTADIFVISALYRLGRWGELADRVHEVLRGASARGDLYAAIHCRLDGGWCAEVTVDRPEEAHRRLDEALELSSHREGVHMQQCMKAWGAANVDLYMGDAEAAWRHIDGSWSDMKRSYMLELPMVLMDSLDLRARSAIACASQGGAKEEQRRAWLKAAERDIARIEKEKLPWATALAALLRAGAATVRGTMDEARALVIGAEAAFGSVDMGVHKAVARRRYGEILGGDEGRGILAEADRALEVLGIRAPAKIAAMFAPGRYAR